MSTKIVTESVQHFNLKWTNYTNNLLEIFIEQFNKGLLTDVSLYCEGTLIRAHKMVLAACSSYFAHLFEVYNESSPLIILHGIQLKDLNILIQFMYRGEIKVQEDEVGNILKLSKDLQVKGLSELSDKFISSNNFHLDVPSTEDTIKETSTKSKHENNFNPLETSTFSASEPSPIKLQDENNVGETVPLDQQHNLKDSEKGQAYPLLPLTETNGTQLSQDQLSIGTDEPLTPVYSISAKAFIMFANTMRKKLMIDYPDEQPKDISVRVGLVWKALPPHEKKKFYEKARKGRVEHKVTYSPRTTVGQAKNLKRKRNSADEKRQFSGALHEKNTSTVYDDDDVEFIDETKDITSSKNGEH